MAATIKKAFDHLEKSNYEGFYKDFTTAIIDLGKGKNKEVPPPIELDDRALVAVEVFENVLKAERAIEPKRFAGTQIISDQDKTDLAEGMRKFKENLQAEQKKEQNDKEKEQDDKEVEAQKEQEERHQEEEALLKKKIDDKAHNDKLLYEYQVAEMDAAAFKVLQRRKKETFFNNKEKYLAWAGYFVTGVIAFSFGMVECGTTVAQIASNISMIALAPAFWPFLIPIALGLVLGGVSTYATWYASKDWVNSLFQEFFSGRLTEGLSPTEKKQLAIFAVTLAMPTGVVIAALGVAPFASSLPMILGIAGTVAASAFPPIAFVIAGIVAIGIAYSLFKSFRDCVLRPKNPDGSLTYPDVDTMENGTFKKSHTNLSLTYKFWEFVAKPFIAIKENINKKNLKGWEKNLAMGFGVAITFLFCVTGIAGLFAAAFVGGGSTSNLVMQWFNAGPKAAEALGIAFGAVCSFLSRITFTLKGMGDVCQFFGEKATGGNANKEFSYKKAGLAAIDSGCQGAFYGLLGIGGIANVHVPAQVNSACPATTGARAFCLTARGMFVDHSETIAASNKRRKDVIEMSSIKDKIQKDQDEGQGVKFTEFRQEYLRHSHWYSRSRIKDQLLTGNIKSMTGVLQNTNDGADGRTKETLARLKKAASLK